MRERGPRMTMIPSVRTWRLNRRANPDLKAALSIALSEGIPKPPVPPSRRGPFAHRGPWPAPVHRGGTGWRQSAGRLGRRPSIRRAHGGSTSPESTDRAVIDWQSFNIAPSEWTAFRQPRTRAVTLNSGRRRQPVRHRRPAHRQRLARADRSERHHVQQGEVNVTSLIATTTGITAAVIPPPVLGASDLPNE